MLRRSDIQTIPEFYKTYTNQVDDVELLKALQLYSALASEEWLAKASQLKDKIYAENKWTVKQLIQHLIDAERVFAYRALRIARGDKTPLPGFDENSYCENVDVSRKTFSDLVEEFSSVRKTTIQLFRHLDEPIFHNVGNCSGSDISVLGLGFAIIGHQVHHCKIIEERYFPLLKD